MIIKIKNISIILISSLLFIISCMEELTEPVKVGYHSSADLITYLETHGDFISSSENPAIISVDSAYMNLSNYLLMDIRTTSQYSSGHIEGARNFGIEELIDSLKFNNVSLDAGIIIISESGQKAAYATSLLRLFGYTNIFSLNFGMAQWHEQFSEVWINARNDSEWWFLYETQYYQKPKNENKIPNIPNDDESLSTKEFLQKRIKKLLTDEEYKNSIITIQELDATYSIRYSRFVDGFVFCYDEKELYEHFRIFKAPPFPPIIWGGHPRTAAFYDAETDFKASTNLLTLSVNDAIYNYTFNGQRSLYITTYLRLLGYKAKSVHYGAVSMMYNKLLLVQFEESFREDNIRNYPIVN
ncbi:MAG: rhodanese-like domain-containing protein [Melioribacteraceae bacterium]|nr:rhodanese-like domain-containing protein [Melioribacteraceae bacterium]